MTEIPVSGLDNHAVMSWIEAIETALVHCAEPVPLDSFDLASRILAYDHRPGRTELLGDGIGSGGLAN